ncbi:trimethylamine methyltransferase family protein [Candidatus Fermentibacteria bacterium]|nr:trimethylamine methyltransferase family protein [Candidatus Fermentibacteria bacterium]
MTPRLELMSTEMVRLVVEEAMGILENHGIWIEHEEAESLLMEAGATAHAGRVQIPRALVQGALRSAPSTITFWDFAAEDSFTVGSGISHFVPGSAALQIWDLETMSPRSPVTSDLVNLARLVDSLGHVSFQSTSIVASDVPESLADRYRLLIALLYCRKPVITGTFAQDAFCSMQALLEAVRGGPEELAAKPLAMFDCCPSAPLLWSALTTDALLRAARARIPAELVSMPMAGATGPVTLAGCVVQHCAENLSGVVMHQLAQPGAPISYGGSPGIMDMRHGTTPMGAIETHMIDMANAQVGRHLGLPTHAYMGLSDSAWPDYQAGAESVLGGVLAMLAGVSIVSGAGMLKFENRQSLEKLVLDNEFIGAIHRLSRGLELREQPMAGHLMEALITKGHLLDHDHTRAWLRKEHYFPGPSVERRAEPPPEREAGGAHRRALDAVQKTLAAPIRAIPPPELKTRLIAIMKAEFARFGASLPALPEA